MDALTLANGFATIVGLMCNFRAQRRDTAENDYKAFIEWLESKRHSEIIHCLEKNSQLVTAIKQFLEEDNAIIIQKLDAINSLASQIASGIDGLAQIADASDPGQRLSSQALSILTQLYVSGQSRFMEIILHNQRAYQMIDGPGRIEFEEPRFIEDDLITLTELGLLRLEYNSSGRRLFYLTRGAANLIETARHNC